MPTIDVYADDYFCPRILAKPEKLVPWMAQEKAPFLLMPLKSHTFKAVFALFLIHVPERQNPAATKVNRTFPTGIHAARIFPKICVNSR